MKKIEFFRLAAVLIGDESFPDSVGKVRRNLIDSLFVFEKNNPKKASEIRQLCEEIHSIMLLPYEIEEVLDDSSSYIKHYDPDESSYTVQPQKYIDLMNRVNRKNIDSYIEDFYIGEQSGLFEGITKEEFRTLINRFLYEVMNNNLLDFQKVADKSLKLSPETELGRIFTDSERVLINSFLNWDNAEKDKLVFRIGNIGLEYCILSNSNYFDALRLLGVSEKLFYLDTNIIYRALGINGKRRQDRIHVFLRKCNSTRQELILSLPTDKEFRNSIDYHFKHLDKYKTVNPGLFQTYSPEEDIYKFYYQWKTKHTALGIDYFKAYLFELYERFQRQFDIKLSSDFSYSEEDQDYQEQLYHYSKSIETYKSRAKDRTEYDLYIPDKSIHDAKNILLVEGLRADKISSFSQTVHFLVSTDHQLLNWDHQLDQMTPVVLLPSHWLTLMLRFVTRTSDDYRSFVNFINLPRGSDEITNQQLCAILEGIGQITQDSRMQENILKRVLEVKFDKILKSRKPEKIIERTIREASAIRDQEIQQLEQQTQALKVDLTSAEKGSKELGSQVDRLSGFIRQQQEKDAVKRWKKLGWLAIVCCALGIMYYLLQVFLPPATWNLPALLASLIDSITTETVKVLFQTLNYAVPTGFIVLCVRFIYIRLLSTRQREKYIKTMKFPNVLESQ